MDLPPELWEHILGYVVDWDVVNCAYVCQMWHHLLCRRIKEHCLRTLPEVYLRELLAIQAREEDGDCVPSADSSSDEGQAHHPNTWLTVFELHLQTRTLDFQAKKSLPGNEFLESFGDLVVIDDVRDGMTLLNFFTLPSPVFSSAQSHEDLDGKTDCRRWQPAEVMDPARLCALPLPGRVYEMVSLCRHRDVQVLVASILGSTELLFLCVRRDRESVLEITKLPAPAPVRLYCAVTPHRSFICADNSGTLALASSEASISLLRVEVDAACRDSLELRAQHSIDVQFSCTVSRFFLYQNTLKTVVKSGEVLVHQVRMKPSPPALHGSPELEAVRLGKSEEYRDLAYPNPTFFCQHYLFVSTFVTHRLLYYWHMDRDIDYWMVALLPPPTPSGATSHSTSNSERGSAIATEYGSTNTDFANHVNPAAVTESTESNSPAVVNSRTVTSAPAPDPSGVAKPGMKASSPANASDSCTGSSYSVQLQKVVLGRNREEVLAVHYQRGLLFAATQKGTVLVYRLETFDALGASLRSKEGWKAPVLELTLCALPITRVTAVFSDRFIYVFALEKNSCCRLALVEMNWNRALSHLCRACPSPGAGSPECQPRHRRT